MFNLGAGEISVLCLLALIFFGPSKLSKLGQSLGAIVRARAEARWSWSDRLLVCAAVLAFTAALAAVTSAGR